jgi:hypothetical protein
MVVGIVMDATSQKAAAQLPFRTPKVLDFLVDNDFVVPNAISTIAASAMSHI